MFKFFKNWYDSHLTDPNQASLAFIILFVSIIFIYSLSNSCTNTGSYSSCIYVRKDWFIEFKKGVN